MFFTFAFISSLISYEVEINAISEKGNSLFGEIKTQKDVQIGSSGIVIKNLQDDFQAIISYVELVSENQVRFYPFETLRQVNLPKGLWKPQVGDTIRFKENYNRAIILAKNFNSFVKIEKKFDKFWIHSDIFTATLSSIGHKQPLKNDFQYFCQEHSVGLIYIEFQDEVKKVDCLSLKVMEFIPMKFEKSNIQKPFYSRIKVIDSNMFGDGINEIVDFEKYYRKLIE